jgi:hypothetical protein
VVCRFKSRCSLCSGHHKRSNCDQLDLPEEQKAIKCVNCKGNHTAQYGGCPNIKTARKIEQFRAYDRLSYRDAVTAAAQSEQVPRNKINTDSHGIPPSETRPNAQVPPGNVTRPLNVKPYRPTLICTASIGTQTDKAPVSTQTESVPTDR